MSSMGFEFGGVHSSTYGVTVVGAPSQPVLADVRMGEYSLGLVDGSVVDPVSFASANLQLLLHVEDTTAAGLQAKLDSIKTWLNPLLGEQLLVPDWLKFSAAAELNRGWYAVLNAPLFETVIPGRFACGLQAQFKIPEPVQYGATLQSSIVCFASTAGSQTLASGGSLEGLPLVAIAGVEGDTVTVYDGTRTLTVALPERGKVNIDSRLQTVTAETGPGMWASYFSGVSTPSGPVRFLKVAAGAGTTWMVGSGEDCSVGVFWRARWR